MSLPHRSHFVSRLVHVNLFHMLELFVICGYCIIVITVAGMMDRGAKKNMLLFMTITYRGNACMVPDLIIVQIGPMA